jgi:hypothetical protein
LEFILDGSLLGEVDPFLAFKPELSCFFDNESSVAVPDALRSFSVIKELELKLLLDWATEDCPVFMPKSKA